MSACCRSLILTLPLIVIILIIFWSYYAYTYIYCIQYIESFVTRVILLVFYNILFLLFFWCLMTAANISMYEVPFQYRVSPKDHNILVQQNEAARHLILRELCAKSGLKIYTLSPSGYLRYCAICQQLKPDRAHHCSDCQICVLKMDHHCPWINNCVGLANQKQFVLMLIYGFIYCIYYSATVLPLFLEFCKDNYKYMKYIQVVVGCVLGMCFGFLFFSFCSYNVTYLVAKNRTTMETLEPTVFIEDDMTFDLGVHANLISVFGDKPLLWFLPAVYMQPKQDGCHFPISRLPCNTSLRIYSR